MHQQLIAIDFTIKPYDSVTVYMYFVEKIKFTFKGSNSVIFFLFSKREEFGIKLFAFREGPFKMGLGA